MKDDQIFITRYTRGTLIYFLLPTEYDEPWNHISLYDFIKGAYTKRNHIIHGTAETEITNEIIDKLRNIVLRLLLGVFKMCLINKDSQNIKNDIVNEIDHSIIDPQRKQELRTKFEQTDLLSM